VQAFDMVASPRQFERLYRHLAKGPIRVPITARYSLGKAAQALRRLARQHVLGRMILQIRRDGSRF
jgi:D-arabinose 1-dehydrogenase-like Zn-dependent alcohol dehydrogenase